MGKDGLFCIEIQIDRTLAHFGGDGNVVDRDRMETALKEDLAGSPQDVVARCARSRSRERLFRAPDR